MIRVLTTALCVGYFNGTPAATAIFGIDVIAPMHFGNESIDLVVAGPNEGQNNGPFLYTISGTIGATYASVERNVSPLESCSINGDWLLMYASRTDSGYRILGREWYA